MGSNFSYTEAEKNLKVLQSHLNYLFSPPKSGDTCVEFCVREIAKLISPPKLIGEDEEMDCSDLCDALRVFKKKLTNKWEKHINSM